MPPTQSGKSLQKSQKKRLFNIDFVFVKKNSNSAFSFVLFLSKRKLIVNWVANSKEIYKTMKKNGLQNHFTVSWKTSFFLELFFFVTMEPFIIVLLLSVS